MTYDYKRPKSVTCVDCKHKFKVKFIGNTWTRNYSHFAEDGRLKTSTGPKGRCCRPCSHKRFLKLFERDKLDMVIYSEPVFRINSAAFNLIWKQMGKWQAIARYEKLLNANYEKALEKYKDRDRFSSSWSRRPWISKPGREKLRYRYYACDYNYLIKIPMCAWLGNHNWAGNDSRLDGWFVDGNRKMWWCRGMISCGSLRCQKLKEWSSTPTWLKDWSQPKWPEMLEESYLETMF